MSVSDAAQHVPVLLNEVVTLFEPALSEPNAVLVDATLGLGGHAAALLTAYPNLRLIGIDQDPQALALAQKKLHEFSQRVHLHNARFDQLGLVLETAGLKRTNSVQGVFFDLGVSSLQIDNVSRGFSYSQDAPLDMRMNQTQGATAGDLLAEATETQIIEWLHVYGEERFASRVAKAIVKQRKTAPIVSSAQLSELVKEAIPAPARRTGGNPSKRTFQALRIAVNDEIETLKRALPQAIDALVVGGRCAVLSFQSLEDKIVKAEFARHTTRADLIDLPVPIDSEKPRLRLVTRGAQKASDVEVETNPRAGSVRLRAVECLAAA